MGPTMSGKTFAWLTVAVTPLIAIAINLEQQAPMPGALKMLAWLVLVAAAELLPVSLGYGTEVTMAFPIYLALAIVFRDAIWAAMLIAAVGALDLRELRRQIPLFQALFNRAQQALAIAAAAGVMSLGPRDPFTAGGAIFIVLAAVAEIVTNFTLVATGATFLHGHSF
ncbi:MAG TPA: hypothetical protein VFK89_09890, partial [Actinomycetota bacterium]|nr:hypothetical protein [Actinomycetota bacterium]